MTRLDPHAPALSRLAARHKARRRRGFTLVEALVATTLTLILMGAVVRIFGSLGDGISDSRGSLELADAIRAAALRLQTDLAGATCEPIPPRDSDGFIQIIEGPANALTPGAIVKSAGNSVDTTVGDTDDTLIFTTRSNDLPFDVRLSNGAVIKSEMVEVAWYVVGNKLYRKMLVDPSKSLADLTVRENRASYQLSEARRSYTVTNQDLWKDPFPPNAANYATPEELMLTNVIGFDVKVWNLATRTYVDLAGGNMNSPLAPTDAQKAWWVYDTWSTQYEAVRGTAANGLDDNSDGVIDDAGEQSAPPPFNLPLRGVQIKIRCFEPDSRLVREITVVQDFLPK